MHEILGQLWYRFHTQLTDSFKEKIIAKEIIAKDILNCFLFL